MEAKFTWIPIYEELASELINWQDRQDELIQFLENLRSRGFVITPLEDKDKDGASFLYQEMDPFTFFGVFNRNIRTEHRISILVEIKRFFNLRSEVPADFDGTPLLHGFKSIFFSRQYERDVEDVARLWRVFILALTPSPLENPDFLAAFDEAMKVRSTNINLTMGLFWIRPNTFLSLDNLTRNFFGIKLPSKGINVAFYKDTLQNINRQGKTNPELSLLAWEHFQAAKQKPAEITDTETNYWMVGAYWSDKDPQDQTNRFLNEGIWENGYEDKFLEDVKLIAVGDKIAIKSSSTQRIGLPFDYRNRTASKMDIKAIGTVVANRGDGRTVEVEWDLEFKEKTWYFFTNRTTLWRLNTDPNYELAWMVRDLIDFTWANGTQDYQKYLKALQDDSSQGSETEALPYSIDDVLASGAFMTRDYLVSILNTLKEKKAIIVQGAPGVGKTFIARKLAFALMEEQDNERVRMVQFHQSYSYDDFVRGYRPMEGQAGTFGLQNGIFFDFCERARQDPDREYVFIIDEINRGNLSQIFGELLMLIEADKRGKEFAVPLIYKKPDEPDFYVPNNLYLIGLMNLADRSLAMVDYALRRRFSFITLEPQFSSPVFRKWLEDRSMASHLIDLIINKMSELNQIIRDDKLLGENYQIGHSYFCPKGSNFEDLTIDWFNNIVDKDILPLLKEYWFDNNTRVDDMERKLRST